MIVAFDTETRLIGYPDEVNPKGVCLAVCCGYAPGDSNLWSFKFDEDNIRHWMMTWLKDPEVHMVGHNVAFDIHVLLQAFPELTSPMWDALRAGRIHDTMLRERLFLLSTEGNVTAKPCSLADLVQRYLDKDISADKTGDVWRYRYGELENMPVGIWDHAAVKYAIDDARYTREVYMAQEDRRQPGGPDSCNTESLQVASSVALRGMTIQGIRTDQEHVRAIRSKYQAQYDDAIERLKKYGLVRANGTRDQKALCALCEELGVTARTASGRVATDRKTLASLRGTDPRIDAYLEYSDTIKAVTTFIPQMEVPRIHPSFNPMVNTLRTSCRSSDYYKRKEIKAQLRMRHKEHYSELDQVLGRDPYTDKDNKLYDKIQAKYDKDIERLRAKKNKLSTVPSINLQQIPRGNDFRHTFLPEPGCVLIAADYANLELVCAAQTYYKLFGFSEMREVLNSGVNMHDTTGTMIYNDYKDEDIDVEVFKEKIAEGDTDCKFARQAAKFVNLGCPGGQSARTIHGLANGLGIGITLEQATKWREQARDRFLEFQYFFGDTAIDGYIDQLRAGRMSVKTDDGYKSVQRYDVAVGGAYRAKCTYTAAANGLCMQMPAALGKKIAMTRAYERCVNQEYKWRSALYGCKMHIDLHDELVISAPAAKAEAVRDALAEVMIDGMQQVLPDMRVEVEAAIMDRWCKDALAKKYHKDPKGAEV